MARSIGKVAATEKLPTTIDEFFFWTGKKEILSPFDVVKADHINGSTTFGVIEEISHITDSASYLTSFISNDFGDLEFEPNTHRVGMNFVKAKMVGNTKNIYTPVLDGSKVSLADEDEVRKALGLDRIKNPLPCGYLNMYSGDDKIEIPVNLNSNFIIGPEGAHLNISGISGLAAKTSYSMFITKAIQNTCLERSEKPDDASIAFVFFNVKGRDILAIDEPNEKLPDKDKEIYEKMGLKNEPFQQVTYFYPYQKPGDANTYADKEDVKHQIDSNVAFKYKYRYEDNKDNIDLFFAHDDDPTGTMASIINFIMNEQGEFGNVRNWNDFKDEVKNMGDKDYDKKDKTILVNSWRKFSRYVSKSLSDDIFAKSIVDKKNETSLKDHITNKLEKNDVFVIDIARLSEDMQSFVFGDVVRTIYGLQHGTLPGSDRDNRPKKIIIFVDELNKYASTDVPKNSPILRQILDITERGRSLGIILFSAEQFKSAIHDRVKGNCSTHAYGRTNAIEISKKDYRFVPKVYQNMMTRLTQGEYIIENPIFRSLLNIKFPNPLYKQFQSG